MCAATASVSLKCTPGHQTVPRTRLVRMPSSHSHNPLLRLSCTHNIGFHPFNPCCICHTPSRKQTTAPQHYAPRMAEQNQCTVTSCSRPASLAHVVGLKVHAGAVQQVQHARHAVEDDQQRDGQAVAHHVGHQDERGHAGALDPHIHHQLPDRCHLQHAQHVQRQQQRMREQGAG